MKRYDPNHAPNPAEWLALAESTRIRLAEEFHRAAKIKLPNLKIHAVIHATVEAQLAGGEEAVVRAMARLATEGLSRHEAIHAIGSVLAEHIFDILNAKGGRPDPSTTYAAAVDRLTAKSWRGG